MTQDDRKEIFGTLRAPRAPEELKNRVLNAAATALDERSERTLWDLLWGSRVARVAWAGTTLALIAAHVGLSLPAGSRPSVERSSARGQLEQLVDELDLPSVEITPRAEARVMGPPSPAARRNESNEQTEVDEVSG